jgi:hypothetical protein
MSSIKVIGRTVPRNSYSRCLFIYYYIIYIYIITLLYYIFIYLFKHFEQLLRGAVLPITLIKYAQQDADPQNRNAL